MLNPMGGLKSVMKANDNDADDNGHKKKKDKGKQKKSFLDFYRNHGKK